MFFEKVSLEQWKQDLCDIYYGGTDFNNLPPEEQYSIISLWENIKLPQRATIGSAGYDFYSPVFQTTELAEAAKIPTGIRWVVDRCEQHSVLMLFPRSGLGCKKGMRLMNTVGIIDSDYWESDNEGHIMAIVKTDKCYDIAAGQAFMQGIILPFGKVDNDCTNSTRNGGFGSTDGGK